MSIFSSNQKIEGALWTISLELNYQNEIELARLESEGTIIPEMIEKLRADYKKNTKIILDGLRR